VFKLTVHYRDERPDRLYYVANTPRRVAIDMKHLAHLPSVKFVEAERVRPGELVPALVPT